MPRICEACGHRLRADIDTELTAAVLSQGAIARKYHLSRSSVGRHVRSGHVHATSVAPMSPGAPLAPGATPQALIRAVLESLDSVDLEKLPVSQRMQVVRERRMAAEALAKLSPVTAQTTSAEAKVEALEALLAVQDEAVDAAVATLSGPEAQMQFRQILAAAMHSGLAARGIQTRGRAT